MIINTERLELMPLKPSQLEEWIIDSSSLETELNCCYKAEPLEGIFRQIVEQQLVATKADPLNYYWHSFWFLIRKSDRTVIGLADFKDVPDCNGEVEIGYGLGDEFFRQGYMTETCKVMCDWAMANDKVNHILAETENNCIASQKILKKCGFKMISKDKTIWWKL